MNSERKKIISNLLKRANSEEGGLRVLMISTDRNIFKEGSAVRERISEYGKSFRQLHIIIFTKRFQKFRPEKISDNVWVYPTKSWCKIFYAFDAAKVAKREFAKFLPKIISIISTQDPFETGIAGWLLARKFKLPLQIQIHTDFLSPYFWRGSFLNKIRVTIGRFVLKRADGIRVVSERIKNSLKAKSYKLKADPIVLPIFVDIEKIKNTPANFSVHKKYPQFSFIIMTASRLEKEKNLFMAVEIMKDLVKQYPKMGMIIVGEGKEKKKLKQLVSKYNLEGNIIFEGWQNDLISYYKTSNVFLSTSLYEGYGLTLIEALACGCPVISSDVGVAGEVISEGESGFICPVNDKNCFIKRILETMGMPGLKEKLGIYSKAAVNEKLSISKEEYFFRYRQIMENCLRKAQN